MCKLVLENLKSPNSMQKKTQLKKNVNMNVIP